MVLRNIGAYLTAYGEVLSVGIRSGMELPRVVRLGRNFFSVHFGNIASYGCGKFAGNYRLSNDVLVGLRRVGDLCAPVIGNNVGICVCSKLPGCVKVGGRRRIFVDALVVRDVSPELMAVALTSIDKPRKALV